MYVSTSGSFISPSSYSIHSFSLLDIPNIYTSRLSIVNLYSQIHVHVHLPTGVKFMYSSILPFAWQRPVKILLSKFVFDLHGLCHVTSLDIMQITMMQTKLSKSF